jgi:2-C-methyl-D-erythritol 4-phosphate cytidylyltransferase
VYHYLPDVPIPVVEGSERNLKVTHPMDVSIAEHLAGHPPL